MPFPFRLPIVGNITANAQTVFADAAGVANAVFSVSGTFNSHNVIFELSYDSTTGSDGNWQQVAATRTNKVAAETTISVMSAAPGYAWVVPCLGAQFVRARCIAHTSGTAVWRIQPCSEQMYFTAEPSAGVGAGNAVVGSPTRVSARAKNVTTVVANDQVVDLTATLNGAVLTQPRALPELTWQGTNVLTTTADLAIKAAAGAGVRNYVTDFSFQNTSATATGVVIKDGATVIAQFFAPANMTLPAVVNFETAIRSTANTAINIAALVTAANVLVNAGGHIGA